MDYDKTFGKLIALLIKQKLLFIIFAIILIMVLGIASMSLISSDAGHKTLNNDKANSKSVTYDSAKSTEQSDQSPLAEATPTNTHFTTKFIYFIGSFFRASLSPTPAPSQYYGSRGQSAAYPASTQQQIASNNSADQSGNSVGGGGSQSVSQQTSAQNNFLNSAPTPTPVTDIQIVFANEYGGYFTYVPPVIPPIDVAWMKYINYQDHYSIEYPSDWEIVKTTYNGHEGVTLYMPVDAGNIDRPSIAFVGWLVDYLSSSASYTGKIILNGVPGTIYTNGPLGPSSVAAVFQYTSGYLALGSSTSNPVFVYVFDHMLRSIDFNI